MTGTSRQTKNLTKKNRNERNMLLLKNHTKMAHCAL